MRNASKIKQFRKEKRYTQQEMADALGVSLRCYRNYEQGLRSMPYEILSKFLFIRNDGNDRELSKILEEYINEGYYEKTKWWRILEVIYKMW